MKTNGISKIARDTYEKCMHSVVAQLYTFTDLMEISYITTVAKHVKFILLTV
jgi:hypothetical protein